MMVAMAVVVISGLMATPGMAEENSSVSSGRCGSNTGSSNQNFPLPVDMVEIFFGRQNPLYRLMKGIPFGMRQSLPFGTDGRDLDGFGFSVFSPFGAGNGIDTLSGGSGCPGGCCCKGCVYPNPEGWHISVCRDCVTGRVIAVPGGSCAVLGCYCKYEVQVGDSFSFASNQVPTDPNAPTCEECQSGEASSSNCDIVCPGSEWPPPGRIPPDQTWWGPVLCNCYYWYLHPSCIQHGIQKEECDACAASLESVRNYHQATGKIWCVLVSTLPEECCPPQ